MTRFIRFASFVLALALPASALAVSGDTQPPASGLRFRTAGGSVDLLSGVALNAAAATRTITVPTGLKFGKLRVGVAYTYSAATTVTATMTCSMDGTTYYRLMSRSCTLGACDDYKLTDTYTTSAASQDYMLEYDVRGCNSVKVLFGGAGAGAGDLITVQATAIVGG